LQLHLLHYGVCCPPSRSMAPMGPKSLRRSETPGVKLVGWCLFVRPRSSNVGPRWNGQRQFAV
jgi:hypothetical protein